MKAADFAQLIGITTVTDHLDLLLDMLSALPDPVFVLTESGRYAALIGGHDRQHYHNGEHLVEVRPV